MAWTLTTALRDRVTGTSSVAGAFSGGSLVIRNAANATLSTHAINSATAAANVATLAFASAAVGAGHTTQTATNAQLLASDAELLLSTDSVGLAGADIPFNDNTGWNTGDTVSPGNAALTFTLSLA